ncbi:hypothetical protein [Paraburkholderia solisilvae]|nr:hypothetical protein [Paraburkholderia solisilvae]
MTPMKVPEQITNNPDGTSTVIFPEGTSGNNNDVVREFSGQNGTGTLLLQLSDLTDGTSEVFDADPASIQKIVGQVGQAFGIPDVASLVTSIDVRFSGPNETGKALSGTVDTTLGDSYEFSLSDGLKPGEIVSVKEFTGPNGTGNFDETIDVFGNGDIQINAFNGNSGLTQGVTAMQEDFNTSGELAKVRDQLQNGDVLVENFNYDANGKEIGGTLQEFNAQNQLVSQVNVAPSSQPLPTLGGQQAIANIVAAIAGLNIPVPGSATAAVAPPQQPKVMLASAHH